MSRRGSSPVFVGRQVESDRLDAVAARATDGEPSLVLIAGEAGVGKSRLTAEFATRAETQGALVVTGACLDLYEGGVPYAPFVEALRELSKRIEPAARSEVFGPSMETLAGLVPDLGQEPGVAAADERRGRDASDPGARLGRLFDAWLAVLARASSERTLVLVIEDIHWADGSTRDLIRFLTRNVRDERLLLIATYRSDDLHRRHPVMPLLAELERADRVERLELLPLDRDELAAQLEGIMGAAPPPALVESILERSDGLPFYVEELVADGDRGGTALPRTLRDILERRLVMLSEPALHLVRAGAVIGGRIPESTLAAVSEATDAALIEGLREAIETHVLVVADGEGAPAYTFRHALLREAAYDDLLPAERVRLHARLADHLEARVQAQAAPDPSDLADIAVHAYAAHDLPRAFSGSVRALRALVEVVAYREAMAHAERALELWHRIPDAEALAGIDHVELLAMAGRMAAAANRPTDALAHLQAALTELGGRPGVATLELERSLQLDLWVCAWEAHANDVATAAVERAYELGHVVPSASSTVEVKMALGVQRWWDGDLRESARLLEDAVALAEAGDDRSVWGEAMTYLAHTRSDLGQSDRASALLDRSADAIRLGGSRYSLVFSAADRSVTLVTVGRFAEAERVAWDGLELARRYGWEARLEHTFRACIADARFELGRYGEVEAIAQPVLDGQGIEHTIEWIHGTMARVDVARGRLDRASRLLGGPSPEVTEWSDINSTLAHVDLARAEGRFDDVRRIVDAVAADLGDEAVMPGWQILALGVRSAAESADRSRKRRRTVEVETAVAAAERWLDALRAIVERGRSEGGAGPWAEATLATAEAEMGHARGAPDPNAWPPVIDQWIELSHPYQSAVARFRLAGAALQRGGDRVVATDALRAAQSTASAIGAEPLQAEIAALAAAARIDASETPDVGTPDPDRANAIVLTAREGAVMALVAQGHTNREIGERLFISEKTVSVHVSNAMAKLGALSRYEAAAAAERLGLL